MEKIYIKDDYITLSQLLKLTTLFASGGHIKLHIQDEGVYLNDQLEHRRGKKLFNQDIIRLHTGETFMIVQEK